MRAVRGGRRGAVEQPAWRVAPGFTSVTEEAAPAAAPAPLQIKESPSTPPTTASARDTVGSRQAPTSDSAIHSDIGACSGSPAVAPPLFTQAILSGSEIDESVPAASHRGPGGRDPTDQLLTLPSPPDEVVVERRSTAATRAASVEPEEPSLWVPHSAPHERRRPPSPQPRAEAVADPQSLSQSVVSVRRPARWQLERSFESHQQIDEAEAKTLAARFAADYLSWDEEDPHRRAEVLRDYLSDPGAATLGWDGTGRQRAEVVLPGRTLYLEDGRVVVEVTVRVATFVRACLPSQETNGSAQTTAPARSLGPSSAPDPGDPSWRLSCSHWASLAPPITYDRRSRRLVVDISLTADSE